MAEFDFPLPGLQVRIFLGLLRQRRWLIVPLAILGLFVGVACSFLIPRYYRAETQFKVSTSNMGGTVIGPNVDPMEVEVEDARLIITSFSMVLGAARELNWPEYFSPSIGEDLKTRNLVEATRKRINVYLISSPQAAGFIGISYSDKDPVRAADLTNRLREVWREKRFRAVVERLQNNLAKGRGNLHQARKAWEKATRDLQTYTKANRLNPETNLGNSLEKVSIFEARDQLEAIIRDGEADLEKKTVRLEVIKEERDNLDPVLTLTDPVADLNAHPAILVLLQQKEAIEVILAEIVSELHPERPIYLQQLERIEAQITRLRQALGQRVNRTEPNPDFTELDDECKALAREIPALKKELAARRAQWKTIDERCLLYPELREQLDIYMQAQEAARADLDAKQITVNKQEEEQTYFHSKAPLTVISSAYPPAAPNDPSTLVTVLIGLVVGVVLAAALIILSEILRISFRSVEEAERTLSVPVLGAAGYVETVAEVRALRRRRLLFSSLTLALVLSLVTIVSIYFIDDDRLPAFVADLLDQLFGKS